MQNVATTSRFLIEFSSEREFADSRIVFSRSKLLQHAVRGKWAYAGKSSPLYKELAQRLIQVAEHSFGQRDIDSLQEASRVLLNLPIAEARKIGQYYQALAIRRSGKIDESLPLLEAVADSAPLAYRARALQTLGAIYHVKGQIDESLHFYHEARRAASPENGRDLLTTLMVSLNIAGIKSEMGDHRGALADYEKLSPLVQIVSREHPLYFYFYHNELAVEFGELGRIAEAEAACKIALASPFASAYPEWSETRQELEAKRTSATPSIVAFSRITEPEPSPQIQSQRQRVVAISPVFGHEAKPEPSPLIEPQRQSQPSKALNLTRATKAAKTASTASDKAFFQRSVTPFPAKATSAFKAVSILDRVLDCIGPRAPPRPH